MNYISKEVQNVSCTHVAWYVSAVSTDTSFRLIRFNAKRLATCSRC